MKNYILYFALINLYSVVCYSQSQQELFIKSTEAYKAKDYVQFLKTTQQLDNLRPLHPIYTYNLAAAYVLNNETVKAISILGKLVLMNNSVDFEKDADFDRLKNNSEFKEIIQLKSDLQKPIKHSEKVISLTEKDLHPEGLIYLSKAKIWLASSIRKKKIVAFDITSGQCSDWFTESNFSVFAMKTDANEKYLWVATAAMPEMLGFSIEKEGKAEVLKIDIHTKKIIKRFPIEGNHVFGDLIVRSNGNVYVSDSGEAKIYRISNDVMSVWLDLKHEAFNLQGITFNEKQSKLYISDYLKGILVIDVSNPQNRNWLDFPKNTTVKGIDGLVFHENSLFAIHNGVKPIRLIQYILNKNQKEISSFKIIDNNQQEFDEPALATIIKTTLYFFSNSPWKGYDKQFYLDEAKFENPMLYKYDIVK